MSDKTLSDVIDRLKAEGQLTRNSGKHSIRTVKEILMESQRQSLQDKEDAREQGQKQDRQLGLLEEISGGIKGATSASSAPGSSGSGGGGLFGGLLGGGIGGILGGAGLGAAGLGVLAFGGSALIDSIAKLDGEAIKNNVTSLLSIGDDLAKQDISLWKDGGTFAVAMTGIGIGLAAFGVGSGVNALVQGAVDYFKLGDWADKVKANVTTLLSIKDEVGGDLSMIAAGGSFVLAMTGLGLGLTAFGIGSGVAAFGETLAKFSETGGEGSWSAQLKAHVKNLLSIKDDLGGNLSMLADGGTFMLTMAGISAGLVAFGFGSAVAGVGESIAKFSSIGDEGTWSQKIKDHVKTLVSIKDELGGDMKALQAGGVFALTMGGIGAGLAAFGFGSAAVGVGEAINKFTGNEDFAQTIKDRVKTLVSITDELSDGDGADSKAGKFTAAMIKITAGLAAFAGGQFVGTMANAITAVAGLFGVDSPMTQLKQLATDADKLTLAGEALTKISDGLDRFAAIRVSGNDINFESMAKNLAKSLPFIRKLSTGGKVGEGWWDGEEVDFGPEREPGQGGILDPSLRLDELAAAAAKMNVIFGTPAATGNISPLNPAETPTVQRLQTIQQYNSTRLEGAQGANDDARLQGAGGSAAVDASSTQIDASSTSINNGGNIQIDGASLNPYSPDQMGYAGMTQEDYIRMAASGRY
jgi:hypothetical protein